MPIYNRNNTPNSGLHEKLFLPVAYPPRAPPRLLLRHSSYPPVVPLRSVHTDTLQLHTLHYDSVFIRQERYQDRSHDTVYLHDRSVEYRYRLLRDTIREIRHDSIPYEVRIVEPSSPRLLPSLPQSLGWIALILIAGLGCRLLGRFLR